MRSRPLFLAGLALALIGPAPFCPGQDDAKSKAPVGRPSDPLQAAQEDLQNGKIDAALAKVEAVVKEKPKDRQALFALTIVTQLKAREIMGEGTDSKKRKASIPAFLKSGEAARKLKAVAKDLNPREEQLVSEALYNAACSLALDGKPEEAVSTLKEAIDAGFTQADTIEKDDELESLRKRPDYIAAVKSIKEKAAEAERKAAEEETKSVLELMKSNKPFEFSFSLPNIDDKKVSLDDYKGKVVIVDIWGTWCPPCRREIPHFVDLYKKHHDKGLEIVGINYEQEATPAEEKKVIREFLKENNVPYTCVIGDEDTQKQVPDFEGYPTTLFLDRTGKVRLKLVGGYEKGALEAAIKTLMDEK